MFGFLVFFLFADLLVPRSFQADILFIMDSSADVSREDYEKEKDFVVTLAKYLRLSPGGTRAGLLTYGYTPTLIANYDSYDRLEMFKNATYKAPYIGGKNFDPVKVTFSFKMFFSCCCNRFSCTFIIWLCLTRTGNYKIHEFDWLKLILTAV